MSQVEEKSKNLNQGLYRLKYDIAFTFNSEI